jgi:hypothetical protein
MVLGYHSYLCNEPTNLRDNDLPSTLCITVNMLDIALCLRE